MPDRFDLYEFVNSLQEETSSLLSFLEQWTPKHLDEGNYLASRESFSTIVTKDGHLRHLGRPSGSVSQSMELTWAQSNSHLATQNLTTSMNPELEAFDRMSVFADIRTGGFAEIPKTFFSLQYPVSFITLKALEAIKVEPTLASVNKCFNPRGGRFQPVGVASLALFLDLAGREVCYVNFLVLDVDPDVLGAWAIVGKPDIAKIFGPDWRPTRTASLQQ